MRHRHCVITIGVLAAGAPPAAAQFVYDISDDGHSTAYPHLHPPMEWTPRGVQVPYGNLPDQEIALRRQIGYLPESVALYDAMTGTEVLRFFARLKGLGEVRVVMLHAFKNVLIPVVTVLGLEIGNLLAGSIVTETVFAYPGVGKLLIDAINRLDRPVIISYLTLVVLFFVVINLIVDLIYTLLDPRARGTIK